MLVSYVNLPIAVPESETVAPNTLVLPSAIAYTGHTGGQEIDGKREVRFDYEARTDSQLRFTQGGSPFVAAQRLSRITTFVDHEPVKNYRLKYLDGNLSKVQYIFECARGDDSKCKPPTKFDYAQTEGFNLDKVGIDLAAAGQLDINGDGRPDFMATDVLVGGVPAQPSLKAAQVISDVTISGAALALDAFVGPEAGFAVALTWDIIKAPFWGMFAKKPTITFEHTLDIATGNNGPGTFNHVTDVKGLRCGNKEDHPAFMLDYDQDGRDDVISACGTTSPLGPRTFGNLYVALSVGDGSFKSFPDDNSPIAKVGIGFDNGTDEHPTSGTDPLAGPILIDIDGDGLQDIVSCPDQYTVELRRRLTPPLPFETTPISLATLVPTPPQDGSPPTPRALQTLCGWARPTYNSVDLDGDGTPDLLAMGVDGWRVLRLSYPGGVRAPGIKPELSWQPVAMPNTGNSGAGQALNLGDFNGDGLPDVFGYDNKQYTVWLNTGGARFYARNIPRPRPPLPPSPSTFGFKRVAVLDLNNDGHDDLLEHWQTPSYDIGGGVFPRDRFNWGLEPTGNLQLFTTDKVPSIQWIDAYGQPKPGDFTLTADVNGDGRSDLLGSDTSVFYGAGDVSLTRITDGLGKIVDIRYGTYQGGGYKTDGRCASNAPGSTWPEKCLPRMSGLVAGHAEGALDASGSFVSERTYSYTFVNGRMNLTGHGWLGFDRRVISMSSTVLGDGGTTTTIDYEPVARYTPGGQPATDLSKPYLYPFAGLPRTTTVDHHAFGGNFLPPLQDGLYERRIQTVNQWRVQLSAFNRPFPVIGSLVTGTFDRRLDGGPPPPFEFNGTLLSSCNHELDTDPYGNVASDKGACRIAGLEAEFFQTTKDFAPDPLTWLISTPEEIHIYKSQGTNAQRDYRLKYSGGLVESVTRAPDDTNDQSPAGTKGQWHRTTYVRDDFGNIKQISEEAKGSAPRTTIITYDDDGIFPAKITNPASQTTKISFDSRWGSPTAIVDPSGVAAQFVHDGFGRLTQRHGPDGDSLSVYSAISTPNPITAIGAIAPKIQVQTQRLGADGSRDGDTITEYDAYGRPVRMISEGFAGAQVIQERVYDQLGRVIGNTLPHTTEDLDNIPYDHYSYEDSLKRLTRIDHSDGSFKQYEYASAASLKSQYYQWYNGITCEAEHASGCPVDITRTIDEESRENVTFTDHAGKLTRSIDGENTTNTVHTSNYVYGAFDQLIVARDNRNLATQFWHDDYGRLLIQTDPDTGDSAYTYSGFDELQTSKDPKQQLRTYNHDSLGRVESIVDPDGLTQWIYDPLGRLIETISPGTSEDPAGQHVRYSYEPATPTQNRGYLQSVTYTVDGVPYVVGLDYDDLGRPSQIHYPQLDTSQPIVAQYQYDTSGVLTGLNEIGSGTSHSLWQLTGVYQGHLTQNETLGSDSSAMHTTYGYDDARRWLKHIQTSSAAEDIQILDYTHYANGLVHTRAAKDASPREYQYDQLNRLAYEITSPPSSPALATNYAYDDIGNLIGQGTTSSTYLPNQPHLLDRVGSNSYSYDANGNVASRTGPDIPGEAQIIGYTPFDLPRVIQTPNSNELFDVTRFDYTADEERVVRRDPSGTIRHFIADLYQRKLDSANVTLEERFRLYAGDRQIAEIVRKGGSEQTLFFHQDHLGSPETISDSNGAAYHQQFEPFGKPTDAPNPELTRVGFTGQDHDNDLGLIDMKGRVYDPLAGRFMTADPITQAPFWSQGLNRYSYVFNNPINNVDPSGFMANGGEGTTTIMGWGGAATGIAALQGFGVGFGAIAGGAGLGALNPLTSALMPSIGDGSEGSRQSVAAPTTAPKGGMGGGAGARANNQGGPSELARPIPPPDLSIPDSLRGPDQRLVQNFQYGGYCHEDGPCNDSVYVPDISGGDFARAGTAIGNWFSRIWRWVFPATAAEGGGETVSLFRAVGDAELKVIESSGGRIPASLSGLESKYFSATAEGAASYARQAVRGFGDAPYTLVESQISRSSLPADVLLQVDRNVPAVVLPNGYLGQLGPASIWSYMPVPR